MIKIKSFFCSLIFLIAINCSAQLTRPQLITEINNNIFNNSTHQITGAILNTTLKDIVNSDANLITNGITGTIGLMPYWNTATTFSTSATTITELNYVSGCTSNIQTQINSIITNSVVVTAGANVTVIQHGANITVSAGSSSSSISITGITTSSVVPVGLTVTGSSPSFTLTPTLPYTKYSALLTQTGTLSPVATIFENTIGTITWTRVSPGIYSASGGTIHKTLVFIDGGQLDSGFLNSIYVDPTGIRVITADVSGGAAPVPTDGLLNDTSIEIIVYP